VTLAVKVVAVAFPLALVETVVVTVEFAKVPEAPEAGAVKVTEAFGTGLPYWSATRTSKVVEKAVPTVVVWLLPCTIVIESLVVLAVFVSEKLSGFGVAPEEVTLTLYEPAVVLAVKVSELARPPVLVVAVHEATAEPPVERQVPPFDAAKKVPLGPLEGAVKVTVAPETGLA